MLRLKEKVRIGALALAGGLALGAFAYGASRAGGAAAARDPGVDRTGQEGRPPGSGHTAGSAVPPASAAKGGDPTIGLETLADPRHRALPERSEIAWLAPGAGPARGVGAFLEDSRVQSLLGPGWTVERRGRGGAWSLFGPPRRLAGGASAESVRSLLRALGGAFDAEDADTDLEVVYDRAAAPSGAVRLRQRVAEAPVMGALVTAHFDPEGRLRSLQSSLRPGLSPVNRRVVSSVDAAAIARDDLLAAKPGVEILGEARVEPWIWPLPGGPGHVWLVRHATKGPWGSYVTRIDASTGAVLAREDLADRALLTEGAGLVYRTNLSFPDDPTIRRLPGLYARSVNPPGYLQGIHVGIVDGKLSNVASTSFRYDFDPVQETDSFDQVSAYYHLERAHARFAKRFGVRGLHWFDEGYPVRADVNRTDLCDAYYSTDLFGFGVPGFAFGDQGSCAPYANPDFTTDSDVIYHEYTHAVVDWMGIDLALAPLASYQRAISEGDADYHAANFTGDPQLGEVIGIVRNLDNLEIYPTDVPCLNGQFEAHCTGEIWSGFLWDLQSVVKKPAERLEFASIDYLTDRWPAGHVETWIDFWDGVAALLDADRDLHGGRFAGLIYGAAVSRGIIGTSVYEGDQRTMSYATIRNGARFQSVGWVYQPRQTVTYFFVAPIGSHATIKVRSTSALQPSFRVAEGNQPPFRTLRYASVVTPTEASLELDLPSTLGVYVLDVFGVTLDTGSFQVSIVDE